MKREERRDKMRQGSRKGKKSKGTDIGFLPAPFLSLPPFPQPPTKQTGPLFFSRMKHIFSA